MILSSPNAFVGVCKYLTSIYRLSCTKFTLDHRMPENRFVTMCSFILLRQGWPWTVTWHAASRIPFSRSSSVFQVFLKANRQPVPRGIWLVWVWFQMEFMATILLDRLRLLLINEIRLSGCQHINECWCNWTNHVKTAVEDESIRIKWTLIGQWPTLAFVHALLVFFYHLARESIANY